VCAFTHGRLEEGVDDALPSHDVLLVVGDVVGEAPPPVLVALVDFLGQDLEPVGVGGLVSMVVHGSGHHLLLELLPEEAGRGGGLQIHVTPQVIKLSIFSISICTTADRLRSHRSSDGGGECGCNISALDKQAARCTCSDQ
jgi:hypothetical protein